MNAALDTNSVTLGRRYRLPEAMAKGSADLAFNVDQPVAYRLDFTTWDKDPRSKAVARTDQFVRAFDLGHALTQELSEKAKRARANLQAYQARIETLRADAIQDGYDVNIASERDFLRFIRSEPFICKGNLVLMDNGNLRAVWKGAHGTHIGLQFLGGSTVQYVIFKRRAAGGAISRVAGRDSIDGVRRQIAAFDLRPLIYA